MNRRSFLQTILASATAPYVVTTAGVLMPLGKVWSQAAWRDIHTLVGDGVADDTAALQAFFAGKEVLYQGQPLQRAIAYGTFLVSDTIHVPANCNAVFMSNSVTAKLPPKTPLLYMEAESGVVFTGNYIKLKE